MHMQWKNRVVYFPAIQGCNFVRFHGNGILHSQHVFYQTSTSESNSKGILLTKSHKLVLIIWLKERLVLNNFVNFLDGGANIGAFPGVFKLPFDFESSKKVRYSVYRYSWNLPSV